MIQTALLPDGRLHLQHGPIDLICQAWGTASAIRTAYAAAAAQFPTVLPALVQELPHLRTPLPTPQPNHPVAQAMHAACTQCASWPGFQPTRLDANEAAHDGPNEPTSITPMAAVAGAVADHILSVMRRAAPLQKAYVNNGGDIALHLTPGHTLSCGIVTTLAIPTLDATLRLSFEDSTRGIATSGRACKRQGGRSFSLGIADSVTILARTAAEADAAATIVANAVNLDHPGIQRRPAWDIDPDSDLGPRLVTWSVPPLARPEIRKALDAGLHTADTLRRLGLIHAAFLALQGQFAATHQPERHAA